ncbi:MAG: hypothetical protein K6E47_13445, partial [Lachnospiraceae bacterium]|nr:hypothetical protein [Lachnospiraceae bacterium]
MNKNSENPKIGASFQESVAQWFRKKYNKDFVNEKKIPIGYPPKNHKFDIVALDDTVAVECKCYTWTETGNVPSAKIGFVNEAAFYLSFLPDYYEKYIVMLKASHDIRNETLAEYYYRTNKHLLGAIKVAEYEPKTDTFTV